MKHTPTPWRVGSKHFIDAPIGNGRLQEVAYCGDCEVGDREANASYIVYCVNYHKQLVEALQDMVEIADDEFPWISRQTVDRNKALLDELHMKMTMMENTYE